MTEVSARLCSVTASGGRLMPVQLGLRGGDAPHTTLSSSSLRPERQPPRAEVVAQVAETAQAEAAGTAEAAQYASTTASAPAHLCSCARAPLTAAECEARG